MRAIDWVILIGPIAMVFAIALYTRRYVRDAVDFLASGRAAGRYLVCVGEGTAAMGLISVVGMFEMLSKAGIAITWWNTLTITILPMFLALTGFIIYRYRETRVLTMAQFLEERYSRRFRVFIGLLAWVSGIVNFGIFPAVGGRFFVYFCGLPETIAPLGFQLPTYALLMGMFLVLALALVLMGGQLHIMVTDCVQGLICGTLMVGVIVALLMVFDFDQMHEALASEVPGHSLINPFDTAEVEDFNIAYVLMAAFGFIYMYMSWQGNQGFNASAINPHEAKMGRIIGGWRTYSQHLMLIFIAVAVITFLRHPDFSVGAMQVGEQLSHIDNPQLREQVTATVALKTFLPLGVTGMFAAIMFFLMVSTDTSYLHSWGAIFVQDVVLPFRKRPLSTRQHLTLLRCSIVGVAAFAFMFSLVFKQNDYIYMFMALTGAVFTGGAGSVIIGGLYWRKGTTTAAWASMLVGSVLATGGIIIRQVDADFPLNGQVLWFLAILASIVVYVVVSLLTNREDFNLDRMLHRGPWAVREDCDLSATSLPDQPYTWRQRLTGTDRHFTRGDRRIGGLLFGWNLVWLAAFIVVTVWNLIDPWPDQWWWYYAKLCLLLAPVLGIPTTLWLSWGGVRDLVRLFRRLRGRAVLEIDDEMAVMPEKSLTNAAVVPVVFAKE